MRLDKFLASCGFGSRKQVKELIRKGFVEVNHVVVKKDDIKIDEVNDCVYVEGQQVFYEKYVYIMLNKPSGVVSATSDAHYKTVVECIDEVIYQDIFPVGRLDIDTEGLLLLTNDGELAHRLLSPRSQCNKKYYVLCECDITDEMILKLESPLNLKDVSFKAGKVEKISSKELYLTIQEGKFHQVKKMVHHAGNEVCYLKRVQMGNIKLDENLKVGESRRLTAEEIQVLGGRL